MLYFDAPNNLNHYSMRCVLSVLDLDTDAEAVLHGPVGSADESGFLFGRTLAMLMHSWAINWANFSKSMALYTLMTIWTTILVDEITSVLYPSLFSQFANSFVHFTSPCSAS